MTAVGLGKHVTDTVCYADVRETAGDIVYFMKLLRYVI